MKNLRVRLIAVSIAFMSLAGCTDKDRQTIHKAGNGAESFRFDGNAVAKGPNPATGMAPARQAPKGGGTTFRFDPKAVPRANTQRASSLKKGK